MLYKFIFTNKETQETKQFKTLREIENCLKIDYFQVRSIYLESKKPKKYLHPITKQLTEKYEIKDNPNMFKYENI